MGDNAFPSKAWRSTSATAQHIDSQTDMHGVGKVGDADGYLIGWPIQMSIHLSKSLVTQPLLACVQLCAKGTSANRLFLWHNGWYLLTTTPCMIERVRLIGSDTKTSRMKTTRVSAFWNLCPTSQLSTSQSTTLLKNAAG